MTVKLIILLILCLTAAVMDMITLKVNNSLIITGCLTGLFYSFHENGIHSLALSLLGALIPVLLLFIPFILKLFGAGDIKLFSMIGVFLGPSDILLAILYAFLAGAIIGTLKYIISFNERGPHKIPFALPTFLGVLVMTGGML